MAPDLVTPNKTGDKAADKLDRAIWEISLAFAVCDALRAGNLSLAQSRDHVSFSGEPLGSTWYLVYDDRSWQETRK